MKKLIYIVLFAIMATSCQETSNKVQVVNDKSANEQAKAQINEDGYKLMKQYCFVCHIEKMDRSKRGQMIAPPMRNVQEHYKPTYPNKKDFINAIVKWANKPNEEGVKMPGATRKFGLMPPLPIGDDKLAAIADALYDMDFGTSMHQRGKGMHQEKISLNEGKKWQLQKDDMRNIKQIVSDLDNFKSNKVADYRQLGRNIFDLGKKMMLNKSYDEKLIAQIRNFFHKVEGDMHSLMSVKSSSEGEKYKKILQKKFHNFFNFFE
jgi:hypothetical protein